MKSLLITLTFLLVVLNIGAGNPTCMLPDPEEVKPCTCMCMKYGLHIRCADFNDSDALIKTFKVLQNYKASSLLLHGLKMKEVLPSDLFDGLGINKLNVENSSLNFPQPAFTGLDETLEYLNVAQHTMIKSSESFNLAQLNKLTDLTMKKNTLITVKNQWLNGKIPKVERIWLDEDQITEIESSAFADMPHLQHVSIAINKIQTVKRSMFPTPALLLKTIDLSGNLLESIPYDFFYQMPKLKEVILSSNRLTTLPDITWKSKWEKLDSVLLYDNFLMCDDKLNWMKKLKCPTKVIGDCVAPGPTIGKTLKDIYCKTQT